MAARRSISWAAALRDIKDDRSVRQQVREERLRTPSSAGYPISAWRGQSGRRYVVGVHAAAEAAISDCDVQDCLIFVARDAAGVGRVIGGASNVSPFAVRRVEMLRDAIREGASEMHVYRLAESDAERRAFVADLCTPAHEVA